MVPSSRIDEVVPCSRCSEDTERLLSAGNSSFRHNPDGPRPQNTGVSATDHDIDRVIGRDAELRLKEMQKRQDYKQSVMRNHDTCGDYLSRTAEGDYTVMTETERVAAKKARIQHQDAVGRIQDYIQRRKRQEAAAG